MGNRLYVGNLAFSTTDEALRDAFAEFGEIVEAQLMIERETGLQDLATDSGVPLHADLRAELLATITSLINGLQTLIAHVVAAGQAAASAIAKNVDDLIDNFERLGTEFDDLFA